MGLGARNQAAATSKHHEVEIEINFMETLDTMRSSKKLPLIHHKQKMTAQLCRIVNIELTRHTIPDFYNLMTTQNWNRDVRELMVNLFEPGAVMSTILPTKFR
jgi:hypothetical protein